MSISFIVKSLIGVGGNLIDGNLFVNPLADTIIVDTNGLQLGYYYFGFVVTSSVACIIDIEHRDESNSQNKHRIRIRMNAGTEYPIFWNPIQILNNERIRLKLIGGITGEIQGSIFYIKVH
ncbi:MAG: hypothetical protein QXH95_03430 [Thermoplasmata archaeon]